MFLWRIDYLNFHRHKLSQMFTVRIKWSFLWSSVLIKGHVKNFVIIFLGVGFLNFYVSSFLLAESNLPLFVFVRIFVKLSSFNDNCFFYLVKAIWTIIFITCWTCIVIMTCPVASTSSTSSIATPASTELSQVHDMCLSTSSTASRFHVWFCFLIRLAHIDKNNIFFKIKINFFKLLLVLDLFLIQRKSLKWNKSVNISTHPNFFFFVLICWRTIFLGMIKTRRN